MARKRRAISITLAPGCFWLGRLMKKIAFAAIAALGFAGAASAADMPVKAPVAPAPPIQLPYNWGGLYLGGHVGYLWGRTRVEEDGLVTEPNASTSGVIGGARLARQSQSLQVLSAIAKPLLRCVVFCSCLWSLSF